MVYRLVCLILVLGFISSNVFAEEVRDREEENNASYDSKIGQVSEEKLKSMSAEIITPKSEYVSGHSRTVVTPDNFNFRVAPDRPIEKYASYTGPIGLDSYIYQKFEELDKKLDSKFSQLESRLAETESTVSQVRTLLMRAQGSQAPAATAEAPSSESASPAVTEPVTEPVGESKLF